MLNAMAFWSKANIGRTMAEAFVILIQVNDERESMRLPMRRSVTCCQLNQQEGCAIGRRWSKLLKLLILSEAMSRAVSWPEEFWHHMLGFHKTAYLLTVFPSFSWNVLTSSEIARHRHCTVTASHPNVSFGFFNFSYFRRRTYRPESYTLSSMHHVRMYLKMFKNHFEGLGIAQLELNYLEMGSTSCSLFTTW